MATERSKHQISIDYCRACGYEVLLRPLLQRLEHEIPEAQVTTRISVRDSFEVKYNGYLLFSKLELGGFPNMDRLVDCLRNCVNGLPPVKITESEHRFYCALL
ncbi:hypothetical protein D915_008263 [Fasciola hepatica]|uniref:SelT/selW/selH selenoprotein n=1 Tax=Fasciola hepatica TaxID=6192 RepID=A0A4E0R5W1_FASHE|nr:hypothetical protein D915_008263 [Fasciola hepatica]